MSFSVRPLTPTATTNADFGDLLYAVGEVNGLERLRFTSPHPADATDSMIDAMANSPAVCKHLHLPLQSGSTEVLERMRRTYTAEEYRNLVSKLRERIPDIAITTDVIVGFCGETEEEFKQTYEMMADIRLRFSVHVQVFRTRGDPRTQSFPR